MAAPRTASDLWLSAGGRLGLELGLTHELRLRLHADLLGTLRRESLTLGPLVAYQVWTGIGSNLDFSTGNTCGGWTGVGSAGSRGVSTSTTGDAFAALGDYGCGFFKLHLYCVEQP